MEKVGDRSVRFTFNEKADREFPLMLSGSTADPAEARRSIPETLRPVVARRRWSAPALQDQVAEARRKHHLRARPRLLGQGRSRQGRPRQLRPDYRPVFPAGHDAVRGLQEGRRRHLSGRQPRPLGKRLQFPGASARATSSRTRSSRSCRAGMFGFVFNTRRPVFTQPRSSAKGCRSTSSTSNGRTRTSSPSAYNRTQSFWQNSDLSSFGVPADERELKLLGPIKDQASIPTFWMVPTSFP